MLRDALSGIVPVLGALRREAQVETPSRHLGLVPVAERAPEAVATVERLGRVIAQGIDLDRLLEIAATAGDLDTQPWSPPVVHREQRPVVALAGGPAFTFAYAETEEALTAAGADVRIVDPLRDELLPEGTAAVVLPGGFPEVYAEQLAANDTFLDDLRAHLDAGRPAYAECAGLLLLCKALDGTGMVGHVDAIATMTPRLTLGYRTVVAHSDSVIASEGTVLVGHEFHRTTVDPRAGKRPAWQLQHDGSVEGFTTGEDVLASYVHLHPAGAPELALRLVERAARACT
jgi:cobyrinic acid a,c-diamide synthase